MRAVLLIAALAAVALGVLVLPRSNPALGNPLTQVTQITTGAVPIPAPVPGQPVPATTHYHPLVEVRNWGNVDDMVQCNGWEAASSGRVFYIGVKAA